MGSLGHSVYLVMETLQINSPGGRGITKGNNYVCLQAGVPRLLKEGAGVQ